MLPRVHYITTAVCLLLMVLECSTSTTYTCSTDNCSCDNETKIAYCDNLMLNGLPYDLPADTEIIFARNNSITELFFLQFGSLRELYLQNNSIKVVGVKAFLYTGLLTVLDLSHNNIGEADIDWSSFILLDRLKSLRLSYNGLTVLHAEMFGSAHFPKVEFLDLSFNGLHTVRGSPFETYTNLQTLLLNNNKIKRLSRDTFKGLVDMNYLNLRSNKLSVLPSRLFTYQSNSTNISLDLSYNRIFKIHPEVFVSTERFGLLDLSHNNLKTLPVDSLRNVRSVLKLVLDSNPIQNLTHSEWNSTVGVEILSVCNMPELTVISESAFLAFKNSRTLLLENNRRLENVSKDAFKGLSGLKHLSLRNCSLETLSESILSPLKELVSVDLSGNRWNCNCDLVWLSTALMQPQFSKSRNMTRCFNPPSLRDKIIVDLKVFEFSCMNWTYTVVIPCCAGAAVLLAIGVVAAYRKRGIVCSGTRYQTFVNDNAAEQLNEQF